MCKFRFGDIVRVKSCGIAHDGHDGKIIFVSSYPDPVIQVRFGSEYSYEFFKASHLEFAGPYGKHHAMAREICGGCGEI